MELPQRSPGDSLLRPGEMTDIRRRLRRLARRHDLTTVIASAYDRRTRMLPFLLADTRMAPAGVRAVGAAMADAGFEKTRIVLQQWNRNFRPSRMALDGRTPDLFMISSVQVYTDPCTAMIRDACRIDPGRRPLIIAGGPKAAYQPWDLFSNDPEDTWGADVAVTGESYVLLNLLQALLVIRAGGESMRTTFLRAARSGLLDDVPGLVYPLSDCEGVAEELVDTGIQRLVGDLDELPDPVLGYGLLEPPGSRQTLNSRALPAGRVRRLSPIGSLVMTIGCRFACPYCGIPAATQHQFRAKSGRRVADDMARLQQRYGIRYFFGTDDNFFNDGPRALEIAEALARERSGGGRLDPRTGWGTEVTLHDALRMKDHLALIRRAGLSVLWIGVEDMTATLIRKGQSVEKTTRAFRLLNAHDIVPMPMMMHHDSQPLYTRTSHYGLINQVRLLRKAGAIDMQILMLCPTVGSKQYDEAYETGQAYEAAGGRPVEQRMFDGNYVIASACPQPWRKQLNMIAAYLCFYTPWRLVAAVARSRRNLGLLPAIALQVTWAWGAAMTFARMLGWALRLMRGNIQRATHIPGGEVPMRDPDGEPAAHALPGTPLARLGGWVERRRRAFGQFSVRPGRKPRRRWSLNI